MSCPSFIEGSCTSTYIYLPDSLEHPLPYKRNVSWDNLQQFGNPLHSKTGKEYSFLNTYLTSKTNSYKTVFKFKLQQRGNNAYLVKSGGTGVVTNEAIGFRWTCWNIIRISELLDINSLLLHDRNYTGENRKKKILPSLRQNRFWSLVFKHMNFMSATASQKFPTMQSTMMLQGYFVVALFISLETVSYYSHVFLLSC